MWRTSCVIQITSRTLRVGPAWQEAIAAGLDTSLVELSLKKTPWERLLEHDEALEFADALKAGAKLR